MTGFSDPACSRLPGSWLLPSSDTENINIKHAIKVRVAGGASSSRQVDSGNVVAEQVSQVSANCL